ncbi:MAG: FRG domain-containing protein [Planctomycetales bacterium]|nr:FRG domain-containing protein [Planctomycetales bacterium]
MTEPQTDSGIVTRPHDDAADFLQDISPFGPFFRKAEPSDKWCFRGHGSEKFSCKPAAHRSTSVMDAIRQQVLNRKEAQSNAEQELVEAFLLNNFLSEADFAGLALPDDTVNSRRRLHRRIKRLVEYLKSDSLQDLGSTTDSIYSEEYHSQISLAQHYGVPTCFLDWTRSPYCACYFAAENPDTDSPSIHVYALNQTLVHEIQRDSTLYYGAGIDFITVPRGTNRNLHAQHGLFTSVNLVRIPAAEFRAASIEDEVSGLQASMKRGGIRPAGKPTSILVKFELAREQAGRALELCETMGITRSSLFPDLGNAAIRALKRFAND